MKTAKANATKSKQQKTAKPKKSALKNTFMGVHGVCPELVNLFDYMVDQHDNGSKGVTLGDVENYANNILDVLQQLLDMFGHRTSLSAIEVLDEIEDLSC